MSQAGATPTDRQSIVLRGAVDSSTVAGLLDEGRARLAQGDAVVDFSAVTEADSAALSLLLDWQRVARQHGRTLSVTALPAGLRSLAQLYGVSELLPANA